MSSITSKQRTLSYSALVINKYWNPDKKRLKLLRAIWAKSEESIFNLAAIQIGEKEAEKFGADIKRLKGMAALDLLEMLSSKKWRLTHRKGLYL